MTWPGIEPRSPRPLTNTLPTWPMGRFIIIYIFIIFPYTYTYVWGIIIKNPYTKFEIIGRPIHVKIITFLLFDPQYSLYISRRCPWCNGCRCRKWTQRHEFKSWTRLIAFHISLIPLVNVWIQLFSLQLWVNSRTDWVLQPWWGN